MLSVTEIQTVLMPHVTRLRRVVWPVWDYYCEGVPPQHRLAYDPKAEANVLQRYMVENATREFSGVPGVQFPGKYEFLLGIDAFPYGLPGQVVCRFKRLTSNGHSRNFPTKRARRLRRNDPDTLELEGMPEATLVDVGYVLNGLRTAIGVVQVIRLIDEAFIMSIPAEQTGTMQMPQSLPTPAPSPRFTIASRKDKGKKSE